MSFVIRFEVSNDVIMFARFSVDNNIMMMNKVRVNFSDDIVLIDKVILMF